jgi:hypothetical protein
MKLKETAVLIALTNAFENKKLNVNRAVPFAVDAYKLAVRINQEQKLKMTDGDTIDTTVYFIKEIAKGADGIMGTRDDLIDATTVAHITEMLERNFIEDVFAMITDAIKNDLSFRLLKHLRRRFSCC